MEDEVKSACTPPVRLMSKRHCQSIVNLMKATEKARPRDGVLVCISADLWKRIWHNARKGAK